jgi:flavin reductase (DIM6/NTAB) family NADH-FMN oxidoreductase RutF
LPRPEAARRLPAAHTAEAVERFRDAASRFATGVTVVSTVADGVPHAMTVNAFMSVSLDPLLVAVSLSNDAWTWRRIRRSGVFAVSVLGAGQEHLARWFAHPRRPAGAKAFADVDWRPGPVTGAPVLADGIGYFECEVHATHVAGDHTLVVGRVGSFDVLSERPPLVFARSRIGEAVDVFGCARCAPGPR